MYKLEPILRPMIWGSELWVLSGYPERLSVVAEGPDKGMNINELKTLCTLCGTSGREHAVRDYILGELNKAGVPENCVIALCWHVKGEHDVALNPIG